MKKAFQNNRFYSLILFGTLLLLFFFGSFQQVFGTPTHADSVIHPSSKLIPQIRDTIFQYPGYFFFLMLGCLIVFAVLRFTSSDYLLEVFLSIFNLRRLVIMFQEGRFGFNPVNLLIDLITVVSVSFFVQFFFFTGKYEYFQWILICTVVAYFMKLIVIQLFASIFFDKGEALMHILLHLLFIRVVGVILLPVMFIALYQNMIDTGTIFHAIAYCILTLYMLWLVRMYIKMRSASISGGFYLFLYLCSTELSPIIILVKDYIL